MSQKLNSIFQNKTYENPFKQRIVSERVSNFGPMEQKLILHHYSNMRKSMFIESKKDFDKENKTKKDENVINKKNITNDIKIINTGKRELKFDNLFFTKEDLLNEDDKEKEKKEDLTQESKIFNPFKEVKFNTFEQIGENINKRNKNEKTNEAKDSTKFFNPFQINNSQKDFIKNPFLELNEKNLNNENNPFLKFINKENNTINSNQENPSQTSFLVKDNDKYNPFLIKDNNINNPFLNIGNNNEKSSNPFLQFLDNNKHKSKNPFLEYNTEDEASKAFNFSIPEQKEEVSDSDEEDIEKEVEIERDEENLKSFKEVKYEKKDKFYESEITNLQFLETEKGKSKYITKGGGLFSLQEEKNEKGENIGVFALRDKSTKNIKLQGIIIDSSTVEKAKLSNGVEFIFIKNVLVKYSKYDTSELIDETKITFLRIRVNKDDIDDFYNKICEFFKLVKK